MTLQPFTSGDYVRFIARIVGPRPSGRKTHDWIEPTRPRMDVKERSYCWPNLTRKSK